MVHNLGCFFLIAPTDIAKTTICSALKFAENASWFFHMVPLRSRDTLRTRNTSLAARIFSSLQAVSFCFLIINHYLGTNWTNVTVYALPGSSEARKVHSPRTCLETVVVPSTTTFRLWPNSLLLLNLCV